MTLGRTSAAGAAERVLAEIVRRIVDAVHPDRVVLFGSRARGEARPESDFDLLIVAPSSLSPWRRTVPIYHLLAGLGVAKDIVWYTPEEVEEWRGVRSHFVTTVLREGEVVYEKPA